MWLKRSGWESEEWCLKISLNCEFFWSENVVKIEAKVLKTGTLIDYSEFRAKVFKLGLYWKNCVYRQLSETCQKERYRSVGFMMPNARIYLWPGNSKRLVFVIKSKGFWNWDFQSKSLKPGLYWNSVHYIIVNIPPGGANTILWIIILLYSQWSSR